MRFEEMIISSKAAHPIFSSSRIYDKTRPSSVLVLARILEGLISENILEMVVRVESPYSGVGIADFPSIANVPDVIYDKSRDIEIEVSQENVKTFYRVRRKPGKWSRHISDGRV